MAHKTLVGGTAYEISGGKTLVNGTAYSIDRGKTLISGTAYEVGFGVPVTLTIVGVGSYSSPSVKIGSTTYKPKSGIVTVEAKTGDVLTFDTAPHINGVAQSSKTYTIFSDVTVCLIRSKEYGSVNHGDTASISNKTYCSLSDANAPMATITITGGTGNAFCRLEVNDVEYSSATTLRVPHGAYVYAYARNDQGTAANSRIFLNGSVLKYGGKSMATYTFLVTRSLAVNLDYYQSASDWVQLSITEL